MAAGDGRNLKIRCPTWDQVEEFYARKLKGGRTLTIRVPFTPANGDRITLALGLPNDVVMAIDTEITGVKASPDGKKSMVRMELHGLTDEVLGRLKGFVADARRGHGVAAPIPGAAGQRRKRAPSAPPPAAPTDAPVDEVVDQLASPNVDDLGEQERDVFLSLEVEHRRMREAAAHEVLGVAWDAGVEDVRKGYFKLTKLYHPDVYAKYRSMPIRQLASEVFVHVNKAYDRMRQSIAASGDGIIAGPALLAHKGWVAGFEDLSPPESQSARQRRVRGAVGTTSYVQAREDAVPRPVIEPDSAPVTVSFGSGKAPAAPAAPPAALEPDADTLRSDQVAPLTMDGLFGDMGDGAPKREESQISQLFASGQSAEDAEEKVAEATHKAAELMENEDYELARDHLADALHAFPRSRELRALYHVAHGHVLARTDKKVDAMTQFETALRHDPACEPAQAALEDARAGGTRRKRKTGLFRRFFEK